MDVAQLSDSNCPTRLADSMATSISLTLRRWPRVYPCAMAAPMTAALQSCDACVKLLALERDSCQRHGDPATSTPQHEMKSRLWAEREPVDPAHSQRRLLRRDATEDRRVETDREGGDDMQPARRANPWPRQ
jgi:hypothetical protein